MRPHKTLKTLLLSTLVATTALGATASAAQVYLEYGDAPSGLVDVYLDNTLVFDNVSPGSFVKFPDELSSGQHEVVVTPSHLTLGQQDLLHSAVHIAQNGTYTLTYGQEQDDDGLLELGLALTSGLGTSESGE